MLLSPKQHDRTSQRVTNEQHHHLSDILANGLKHSLTLAVCHPDWRDGYFMWLTPWPSDRAANWLIDRPADCLNKQTNRGSGWHTEGNWLTARFRFEPSVSRCSPRCCFPLPCISVLPCLPIRSVCRLSWCLLSLEPPPSKRLPGVQLRQRNQPCVSMPRAGQVMSRLKREGWGTGVIEVKAAFEPNQVLCRRSLVN